MIRILISVVICLVASGCAAFQPSPGLSFAELPEGSSGAKAQRNATEPSEMIRPDEVAALMPGSQVEINYHSSVIDSRHLGTVLKAGPEGVALMNCHCFSVYKGPKDGPALAGNLPRFNRLYETAEIGRQRRPVEWVSIQRMSDLRVIAPPPPDYVAPQLSIDTDDQPDFDQPGLEFDFNLPASGRVNASLAEIERLSFNRIPPEYQ